MEGFTFVYIYGLNGFNPFYSTGSMANTSHFRMFSKLRWYSKTGTQYRDKLFYMRGVSDEKTV
ncbi:hypothetical protein IAY_07188 [Bacillus cereus TIAC219]|uniref:Uncharacterized protein n=1 Tax=Bacillus cereus TIAC219 TaxID=718222 RepID=A0ABC9SPV0_BACCE|nr:hypothetical protein IAY_07188 [Bacillus cereus TIAC219]